MPSTGDSSMTLSVNISPVQLRDPWFAQKLLKLLVLANFPGQPARSNHRNLPARQHQRGSRADHQPKNQGVTISLDDFGSGYSSLSQLRSPPFDRIIKIDRSFVTTMAEDAESETIIRMITALGEGLRLPITAEGSRPRKCSTSSTGWAGRSRVRAISTGARPPPRRSPKCWPNRAARETRRRPRARRLPNSRPHAAPRRAPRNRTKPPGPTAPPALAGPRPRQRIEAGDHAGFSSRCTDWATISSCSTGAGGAAAAHRRASPAH